MLVSACVRTCHADALLSFDQRCFRDELCRRGPLPFSPGALAPRRDIRKNNKPQMTRHTVFALSSQSQPRTLVSATSVKQIIVLRSLYLCRRRGSDCWLEVDLLDSHNTLVRPAHFSHRRHFSGDCSLSAHFAVGSASSRGNRRTIPVRAVLQQWGVESLIKGLHSKMCVSALPIPALCVCRCGTGHGEMQRGALAQSYKSRACKAFIYSGMLTTCGFRSVSRNPISSRIGAVFLVESYGPFIPSFQCPARLPNKP